MEWRDTGILLATRAHGEHALILEVFTPDHGRHAGVLRGGTSRRKAPFLQPGAQLDLTWRARLEDHIGAYTAEPQRSRAAMALGDRLSLAGLNAVLALLLAALPDREPLPELYACTEPLLDLLGQPDLWPMAYLHWERALLEIMGYGLDLSTCALTGATEGLAYVSPRSGRAVTQAAAGEWADRLLPLPPVLLGQGDAEAPEVLAGLSTTGYFLEHHLLAALGQPVPPARGALLDRIARPGLSRPAQSG